jgi:hypothetical protein
MVRHEDEVVLDALLRTLVAPDRHWRCEVTEAEKRRVVRVGGSGSSEPTRIDGTDLLFSATGLADLSSQNNLDRWREAFGQGNVDEVDRLVRQSRADRNDLAASGRMGVTLGWSAVPSVGPWSA